VDQNADAIPILVCVRNKLKRLCVRFQSPPEKGDITCPSPSAPAESTGMILNDVMKRNDATIAN
jgi:hypothetical protein